MPIVLRKLFEIDHNITRHFELDYLLFDTLFLIIYVLLLLKRRRYDALKAGLVCGALFYLIDGVIWYGTGVREYALPAPWIKYPVDFMMDISYGIVAFGWVWLAFDRKRASDVAFWTLLLFAGWLLVPLASRLIPLLDGQVTTVRHMQRQVVVQIVVVIAGYLLLVVLNYRFKTILYVLWIGTALSFMMEASLFVAGIRPPSVQVLIYETLILTNQGVPYLFVIRDKVLPALRGREATG